ncbi:MAG: hypothetical protein PHT69_00920 [Bacteroidales bacterium]|nr:hypothetical protein [Bacteroidales bacterium]
MHCKFSLIFFVSFSLLIFSSCRKDKPDIIEKPDIDTEGQGVFITNEGNFQFGNAEISYYMVDSKQIINNYFSHVNNKALGDVCQSLYIFNDKVFIVLNNSAKIEVVRLSDFKYMNTIDGFTAPRYFLPVSNNKAYVTDIYSSKISIVDLNSYTISGHMQCEGWTEEILLLYGKAYISNKLSNKLYVAETATDVIIDSIPIGYGANSLIEDKNGKIWVLCGNLQTSNKASLHRINPLTGNVEMSLEFPSLDDNPWRLNVNATRDTLFFLNTDIYAIPINASSLPQNPLIEANGRNFYGLGICPETNVIYVSDAIDFVQEGVIFRYYANGTLINSFNAGIIPGHFYFN